MCAVVVCTATVITFLHVFFRFQYIGFQSGVPTVCLATQFSYLDLCQLVFRNFTNIRCFFCAKFISLFQDTIH